MSKKAYKRKPGDFEVRILSDGRIVMLAPDEELIEVAQMIENNTTAPHPTKETKRDGSRRITETQ